MSLVQSCLAPCTSGPLVPGKSRLALALRSGPGGAGRGWGHRLQPGPAPKAAQARARARAEGAGPRGGGRPLERRWSSGGAARSRVGRLQAVGGLLLLLGVGERWGRTCLFPNQTPPSPPATASGAIHPTSPWPRARTSSPAAGRRGGRAASGTHPDLPPAGPFLPGKTPRPRSPASQRLRVQRPALRKVVCKGRSVARSPAPFPSFPHSAPRPQREGRHRRATSPPSLSPRVLGSWARG